jgi:starch-binding outer membrane protein, SusD/RagB family
MKKYPLYILLTVLMVSCSKEFLNRAPKSGTITSAQVSQLAASSPTALLKLEDASIRGIYSFMRQYATNSSNHDDFGQKAIDYGLDLMTEDMVQATFNWFGYDYIHDNRSANYRRPQMIWNFYYKIIYNANLILEQIEPGVSDPDLKAIRGQALALRAYSYHNLVQLFQKTYKGNESAPGVPVYTITTSLEGKPRGTVADVYAQITNDLNDAITALQGFSRTSKELIDQKVAYAIQARVYLSMENWAGAETAAKNARQGYSFMTQTDYKAGFNNLNNSEWMWGGAIDAQSTTIYASFFSMIDNTSPGYAGALQSYILISKELYDQIPATDVRKAVFNDPAKTLAPSLPAYAQLKFRDPGGFTGDYIYIRVSEMYLIEAEAQARQGNATAAAQTLFDLVSKRNSAYTLSTNTGQALIDEIFLQKRIESWGEGVVFMDLKRMNLGIDRTGSNHVSNAVLVIPAGDPRFTYQIPLNEINANPNISEGDQNP